jgi:hypothetical protein
MHMYFRYRTKLECRNALMLGLKTHSPVDVVPVDDTQRRRTICTAQSCPLHDHILHELDQQFLNQVPEICEQEILNPQLPSTYQCINQSVLCTTHLITITTYVQSIFHRKQLNLWNQYPVLKPQCGDTHMMVHLPLFNYLAQFISVSSLAIRPFLGPQRSKVITQAMPAKSAN